MKQYSNITVYSYRKIEPYSTIYIYTLKCLLLSFFAYKPVSVFSVLSLSITCMFIHLPACCIHVVLKLPSLWKY